MRVNDLPYDRGYLIRCCLGLGAMIAIMYATGGSGFIVAFLILFSCLTKNNIEVLFFTLLMTISVTVGNSMLMPKGWVFGVAQRAMMLVLSFVMIVKIAGSRKSVYLSSFLVLLFYLFYMILPSAVGWCPIISFLKLFLFTMVFVAYYGVANSVINSPRVNAKKIRSIFLMLACFFVIGSFVLIPFPGISQMNEKAIQEALQYGQDITSLFMGMTFHSQALGPIVSMIGVMVYADLIFSVKRVDRLYLIVLLIVPIIIWKTSSRTAMGSFLAGILFSTYFFTQSRNVKRTWKTKVSSTIMMGGVILLTAIIVIPTYRNAATDFVLKYNKSDDAVLNFEEITMSRKGRWDDAMYNFRKKPFIGNGFQVAEDFQGLRPSLMTLSAPVEKSVWIAAVLEEGGVAGFILFTLFAIGAFMSLLKHKCYQGLSAFFMLLLINLGEFVLFSMSAAGGVLWALVFTGVVLDAQRHKEERGIMMGFP